MTANMFIVQVVSRNFSLNRSHDSELEKAFMVSWVVYWTWQVFKFFSLLSVVMGLFTVMSAQCPGLWIEVRLEVTFICYNSSWSCATGVILMLQAREHNHLHVRNRQVCNLTRSPSASLLFWGQGTEHPTVKWTVIEYFVLSFRQKNEFDKSDDSSGD